MNVIFLMISYPDVKKHANLYSDLAIEFHNRGHHVYVIVANGPNASKYEVEEGINVLRLRTLELFNTTPIKKGIANVLLPHQFTLAIKRHFSDVRFDLVVAPTPPITFVNTIRFIKNRDGSKIYLVLRDIFPQNAKDLELIRNPLLFVFFRRKEKYLYSICDYIGCMSQGNVDYLMKHNRELDPGKVGLLPNWLRTPVYVEPFGNLRSELGLDGKFIALFGGNIGKPQKVDLILKLAKECENYTDAVFLVIGKGTEKRKIEQLIQNRHIKNVILKDFIPRSKYIELIKECDLGLVTLNDKFTIPNIPYRTLGYWSAKIPILAAVDRSTDYGKLLEESGGGLWSISGDLQTFKDNFDKIYKNQDLRKEMGRKGYEYLVENLTPEKSYDRIMEQIGLCHYPCPITP